MFEVTTAGAAVRDSPVAVGICPAVGVIFVYPPPKTVTFPTDTGAMSCGALGPFAQVPPATGCANIGRESRYAICLERQDQSVELCAFGPLSSGYVGKAPLECLCMLTRLASAKADS